MGLDLVLKGANVIDPAQGINCPMDIGVEDSKIVTLENEINPKDGKQVIDLSGYVLMPGVIDGHVHVSNWLGGEAGYRMMVKAGTVTAIDFAGPFEDILESAPRAGYGMNIGGLEALRPGINLSTNNPSLAELTRFIQKALSRGAIGIKILGGHFPLTPEATARAIEAAEREKAYVAIHVGTTDIPRSDLNSLQEALELSENRNLHVCHVCTCCIGLVLGDPMVELVEMMRLLAEYPKVVSESHLSVPAYSFSHFENGKPSSHSTQMFLEIANYSIDEKGLYQAMIDGYASAVVEVNQENVFLQGEEGFNNWKEGRSQALGFNGNLPVSLFVSATHKQADGSFSVNALASDGGGIPRNNLLAVGTALVHIGAMSFSDLAVKLSLAPALMYGLQNKGHLKPGADADITVIDPDNGRAVFSTARGNVLLHEGKLVGRGANLLSTEKVDKVADFNHVTEIERFFQ